MKLKRCCFSVLLVLFCSIVLWGCSSKPKTGINYLQPYYMTSLTPYAFTYIDTDTQEIETFKMNNDDYSFLEFDRNFKNMRIVFVTGKEETITFVVTTYSKNKGQIKGTVSRIESTGPERGRILRYSFWSDDETIHLQALLTYRVYTASRAPESDSESHRIVTVSRNTVVAKFARITPSWVGR